MVGLAVLEHPSLERLHAATQRVATQPPTLEAADEGPMDRVEARLSRICGRTKPWYGDRLRGKTVGRLLLDVTTSVSSANSLRKTNVMATRRIAPAITIKSWATSSVTSFLKSTEYPLVFETDSKVA